MNSQEPGHKCPPTLRAAMLLWSLVAGCSDGVTLDVVTHTDLPQDTIASVQIDVGSAPFETFSDRIRYTPEQTDDFLAGVEVGQFTTVPEDDYFVTVELRDEADQALATREMIVRLDSDRRLTVPIDRACLETTCPEEDGPNDRTTCSGGRCVNPFCSSAFPDACEPNCAEDADCDMGPGCTEARCVEGVCLARDRNCGSALEFTKG